MKVEMCENELKMENVENNGEGNGRLATEGEEKMQMGKTRWRWRQCVGGVDIGQWMLYFCFG